MKCFHVPTAYVLPFTHRKGRLQWLTSVWMFLSTLLVHSDYSNLQSLYKFLKKRGRTSTMIWALRVWGISSALLLATAFLVSLQLWCHVEAVRSSRFDPSRTMSFVSVMDIREQFHGRNSLMYSDRSTGLLSFEEAPAFRNGIECPLIRHNNEDPEAICHAGSVHIAMTLDSAYLRGSIAAIYSVVKHATCPESIVFHFLVCDRDEKLQNLVKSTFPYLRFKVYYFDPNLVKDKISVSVRQDLEQPLNYARNYLAGILKPCIHKVIYLDSDLVVVDDIAELWKVDLGGSTLGAPEYCRANFSHYFTSAFWSNVTFANAFDRRRPCYFNTGVMVMDLLKWRQNNYTSRIEAWMEIQKATRIYELGSLPPFLLVFSGSVKAIDHKWNQHGLGGDNILGSCRSLHDGPVSLLHWSGKGKPWMRLDSGRPCPLDSLWSPYDLFIKEKGQV